MPSTSSLVFVVVGGVLFTTLASGHRRTHGQRTSNMDGRNIREVEYRFMLCRCAECISGEHLGIGSLTSSLSTTLHFSPWRARARRTRPRIQHCTEPLTWTKEPDTDKLLATTRRRREENTAAVSAAKATWDTAAAEMSVKMADGLFERRCRGERRVVRHLY